jgi:hypothetical protein
MWEFTSLQQCDPLLVLLTLTSALCIYLLISKLYPKNNRPTTHQASPELPEWYQQLLLRNGSKLLHVDEWKNENGVYRKNNGW